MDKVAWVRQDMLVWAHWNKEVGNRPDELAWAHWDKGVWNRPDKMVLVHWDKGVGNHPDKMVLVHWDNGVWNRWDKEVWIRLDELAWACLSQMVFDMMTEARVRKQDEVYSSRARLFLMFELEEEHIPLVPLQEKVFLVAEHVSQEFQLQGVLL
ncbi:MAG TPA: hypothetical protein VJ112_02880 [Rhabdochlamydiaceae bacterium]|nr:hypothetical protein [Rhabdochlamydiaceae bacterium]